MIVEDLIDLSEVRPFVPFEVHLADGISYHIRHPKWMMFSSDLRTLLIVAQDHKTRRISVPLITHVTEHPEESAAELPTLTRD